MVVDSHVNTDSQTNNNHQNPAQDDNNQPSKGRQRAPLSRDQILDATQICLNDLGYDGTTIRKIASQLGCAVGSIYRYFKDKRDLLAEVTQRRFVPVLQLIEDGAPLEKSLEAYARVAAEEPEQYRLMFWLASLSDNKAARVLPAMVEKLLAGWTQQAGVAAEKADEAWCAMHGGLMIGQDVQILVARSIHLMGAEETTDRILQTMPAGG
ncbi:TetR/AcrR family transcriptional regulator [Mucisphaera sp.]|uniref:TetR/AcrR family transcriptional regulator n=1 Tax=Mucisphaera sp. TaxID=2913024 RepID=UPI003D1385F5